MDDAASAWKLHRAEAETEPARANRAGGESQADRAVSLFLARCRVGKTPEGDLFAVLRDGPSIATPLRGSGSVRSMIARKYYEAYVSVASSSALADAMQVIEGLANEADPELVHTRAAMYGDGILVDLGDASGRCVEVTPSGWKILERSPVLFRRTETIGPIAEPKRGGSIDELRSLINVSESGWPPLVAWMAAAFFPDIAHPIALLRGEQGTGKSTAAEMLVRMIDPGPVPLRPPPRDEEQCAITAAGSLLIAFDNVSSIPPWWSDVLCRIVSGSGWLKRQLYSDHGVAVLKFRRVVLLNGIDIANLRGDLAERLLLVELETIDQAERRGDADLWSRFNARAPFIYGAILDVVSAVLSHLPEVRLETMPRLADFARIAAALDDATGIGALPAYIGQAGRVSEAVLDSDVFAEKLAAMLSELRGEWSGTAQDLLIGLPRPAPLPKDWPQTPQATGSRLTRLAPALRERGFAVSQDREAGGARRRIWRLAPPAELIATADDVFPERMSVSNLKPQENLQ